MKPTIITQKADVENLIRKGANFLSNKRVSGALLPIHKDFNNPICTIKGIGLNKTIRCTQDDMFHLELMPNTRKGIEGFDVTKYCFKKDCKNIGFIDPMEDANRTSKFFKN